MENQSRESFVRWQGRTIEQLGFVNNVILGFSTALLAFQSQLVFDGKLQVAGAERWSIISSTLVIFSSVVVGCYLAWNRLQTLRITSQVARSRETNNRQNIDKMRQETVKKGILTWRLISWQIVLFAIGSLLLTIAALARL